MKPVARAAFALVLTAGTFAVLAQPKDRAPEKPAAPAQPGDTKMPGPEQMKKMQEMMEAYTKAATPGKEHEFLKKSVGEWDGKVKSYEMPGQPPQESHCTETIKAVLGGHFTLCEVSGEMGSMGHFEGLGIYGYDNVKQKYTMAWADNMGTCIMDGTGELSADQKTLTWTMHFTDPVSHKVASMREVDTFISDTQSRMEMFGENPMDPEHKEMKMIEIDLTRKTGKAPEAATGAGSSGN